MKQNKISHIALYIIFLSVVFNFLHCVTRTIHASEQTSQRLLLAGAAASNITPYLGGMIVGGWTPIGATHIHDQLNARCLVLDNQMNRLVFVVCDNVGLPQDLCDAAKQRIHEQTEILEGTSFTNIH